MGNFTLQKPDGKRTKHILNEAKTAFLCGRALNVNSLRNNVYVEGEDNKCCDECADISARTEINEFFATVHNFDAGF